jgi:hypothetical protein
LTESLLNEQRIIIELLHSLIESMQTAKEKNIRHADKDT